jgi:hypothetical protein
MLIALNRLKNSKSDKIILNQLKLCKITILNSISRVYKEYIYCNTVTVSAPKSQKT